jgi:HSP20 family molecular chaperone IbpA
MSEVTAKNHGAPVTAQRRLAFTPAVDILELPDELVLQVDLPGVKADAVDVHFERGELTVKARREAAARKGRGLVEEFLPGEFTRGFLISQDVAADKISAELKNGVLQVHLPKAETAMPRRISVKGD